MHQQPVESWTDSLIAAAIVTLVVAMPPYAMLASHVRKYFADETIKLSLRDRRTMAIGANVGMTMAVILVLFPLWLDGATSVLAFFVPLVWGIFGVAAWLGWTVGRMFAHVRRE